MLQLCIRDTDCTTKKISLHAQVIIARVRGGDTKQKVGGGLIYMGCNCVHVSMPARGVWRHAPPGNFLQIRSSEVHSDAF